MLRNKIVISRSSGGFHLTDAVKKAYLETTDSACNEDMRDDPILIQIIEAMGVEKAGEAGKLKIVELSAEETQWQIQKIKGYERVVQKHREWYGPPTAETPKKIVVNSKYGGFSLSPEVKSLYMDITRRNLIDSELMRGDPALIQIIEAVGLDKAAGSHHAKLRIVGIPADVSDWLIEEYDGVEWVAETYEVYS